MNPQEAFSRRVHAKVTVLDLASPQGRALAARGQLPFPPGVFLDGEPFCYGRLSERKLRRELDRRWQPA